VPSSIACAFLWGEILTSEYCRCWQTAELAFGRYRRLGILTGVGRNPEAADKRAQAAAGLRGLLAMRPPAAPIPF
jgi:hypothetical protein